jgi:prepilin-type N-terminal cleavage/methylation domain-containing protein
MEIKKHKAFTLIELLVVLAILGVLFGMAIPSYDQYILKKRFDEAKVTLKAIMLAQEKYKIENGKYLKNTDGTKITNEEYISNKLRMNLSTSGNFVYSINEIDKTHYEVFANLRYFNRVCDENTTSNSLCYQDTKHNHDEWIDTYTKGANNHFIRVRYPDRFSEDDEGVEHVEDGFDYTHIYTGM